MRYTSKMENYIPLVPPIDKPYIELTKAEAKEYFEWFISHIDERADYLRMKVAEDFNIPIDELNFSVASLKTIWKWFLGIAEIKKTHRYNWNQPIGSFSVKVKPFIKYVMCEPQKELSVFSYFVLRDIGMYVGKVFKSNYPILEWTFKTKPKNYISVNEPLLVGFVDDNPLYPKPFYPDLEPISFVEGCALNLLDRTHHEDDLYELCLRWIEWIPREK